MKVLATGGAGYIGSVVTAQLLEEGHSVMVVDNLSQGHREAVPPGAQLAQVDICQAEALDAAFRHFEPEAVIHMGARALVSHSMIHPQGYSNSKALPGALT